jgi:hypothetical protein
MIGIWKTGHNIADTVADAVHAALPNSVIYNASELTDSKVLSCDIHIAYGILRGTQQVFSMCDFYGKPWFNIDRGYLNRGEHFTGNYRVSLKNTQQVLSLDKVKVDIYRLNDLHIQIETPKERDGISLICPPTDYMCAWKKIDQRMWIASAFDRCKYNPIVRFKGNPKPIDYNFIGEVITYNSAVGWEALLQGIPVNSDDGFIVGAYLKELGRFPTYADSITLFGKMAWLQMSLNEMKERLWPLMRKLLVSSDMIPGKQ